MLVKVFHALRFGRNHQCQLALRILRGDAGRAVAGVTGLCLYAAERKHEAARAVAPVCAQRQRTRDVKAVDDFAAGTQLDVFAHAYAYQCVVHQAQTFFQRHAHVIRKLQRCRAGAAFGAVDHNEVGQYACLQHGFGDAEPFPRMAYAKFETHRLVQTELAQALHEFEQLHRCGKTAVCRR